MELSFKIREDDMRRTDVIISKLLGSQPSANPRKMYGVLNYYELFFLCSKVREIMANEPSLLELRAPLNIFGDLHGQFSDLLHWFSITGLPESSSFLFLGDYVDRGKQSIETISLLFAFKIKYPSNMNLIRGNHEDREINREYGFLEECETRYGIAIWDAFNEVFSWLPVAALIDNKVFCCHGGLGPDLVNIEQVKNISRPTDVPHSGFLCDLLWADPEGHGFKGWGPNERGIAHVFGADVVHRFLARNNLKLMCRAHEFVDNGIQYFANKALVTVFSAPNYLGTYKNTAAILIIDENHNCFYKTVEPEAAKLNAKKNSMVKRNSTVKRYKRKG